MVIEIPEWKYQAKIARNTTFDRNQKKIFCPFWARKRQKMKILEVFPSVSQS